MSDEIRALAAEIHELSVEQRKTHDAVLELRAGLRQRCPNNERRIGEVEKKVRNGNGGSRSWADPKFLTTALIAVAALATAIAAIYGAH